MGFLPQSLLSYISLFLMFICQVDSQGVIVPQPTYAVVTPTKIRPSQDLVVAATILKLELSDTFTIRAVVRYLIDEKRADEICSAQYTFTRTGTQNLILKTPTLMSPGNYTIRVSGFSDSSLEGLIFINETKLFFDSKQVSLFIQTNKPYYNQNQVILIRLIPIHTNLKPVTTALDVDIKDGNGIVVKRWFSQHTNAGGVVTLRYPLNSNFIAYGTWTIVAKCFEYTYQKEISVYEFYGPLFFVNVSMPTYMYQGSSEVAVLVTSTQGNLKGIKGNCTVTLNFLQKDGTPIDHLSPLKRHEKYFDHRASFSFSRQELIAHIGGGERGLISKQLKATAVVEDWFFGTSASGFSSTIIYSDEISLRFLGGEVWSFKPNIPFKIHVAAERQDMAPMDPYITERNIDFSITTTEDGGGETTVTDSVDIPRDTSVVQYWLYPTSSTLKITVRAKFRDQLDTEKVLIATRHWSPNNYYLKITSTTEHPTVGNFIIFSVQTNVFVDHVYYYIISSGNIIVSDSIQMYSRHKLISVALSKDMAPSAKIVAFFISPANSASSFDQNFGSTSDTSMQSQVAADSLQFHVDSTKVHQMKVKFNRGKDFNYNTVEVTAYADPLAYVAFSALEYQMYQLGIRNGLSWEEVYKELYTYDEHANTSITHYWKRDGQTIDTYRASTPAYAHDANTTFYYAGLYIFTDANVSSVYTHCNRSKGEYPCMDGKTCYNYQHMCQRDSFCATDRRDDMGCHLNESTDAILFSDDGWQRTKHIGAFYRDGAFLWVDQFTKPDGRIDISIKPPAYDTSWVVSAFTMSSENGLGILQGVNIFSSGRPMYIHIQAATKSRLGEIIAMRITIFNKWTEAMDILLTIAASDLYKFVEVDRLDSQAHVQVNGQQQILVPVYAGDVRQIYVPIEPVETGVVPIKVNAMCVVAGHSVTHTVNVGHDAIQDRNITNYQVDLRVANSETLPDLWLPVSEDAEAFEQRYMLHIPDSPESFVNVIGDIVGISYFPYAKYDLSTMTLLGQPYGSGAEATFNFAVKIYTLSTLRSLGTLSRSRVVKATDQINIAMQEMYAYMRKDGSFREFDFSRKSSTWVSATALQVMAEAIDVRDLRDDFQLPQETLNRTANWLIGQQSNVTGRFVENDAVHLRRFQSHVDVELEGEIVPANLALTALCVYSLSKASTATTLDSKVANGVSIGANYLAQHYKKITDPFEMAIVTYALLVAGRNREMSKAMLKLKSMQKSASSRMKYWSKEDVSPIELEAKTQDTTVRLLPKSTSHIGAYTVSTTAYALLAYIEHSEPDELLQPIQRFLQEQHMWVGGFSSSQDTLIAMQALKAVAEKNQDRQTYDMTFTFKSDQDPTWRKVVRLNRENWFELQRFPTPSHWGSIQTTVKGHGIALVQLETTQNFDNEEQLSPPPIPNIFDLGNFNYNIQSRGFNHSIIDYKICPRWNGVTDRSGMAVLEVGLPTGYRLGVWNLQKYVLANRDKTSIRGAEFNGKDGIGIFYFDYLDNTTNNCAEFTAFRWYPVANMAELTPIKVYEYYEPGNYFSSYYEKVNLLKLTVCLVCGSYQCPYCPNYNSVAMSLPSIYLILLSTVFTLSKVVLT